MNKRIKVSLIVVGAILVIAVALSAELAVVQAARGTLWSGMARMMGVAPQAGTTAAQPLSVDQARQAATAYLAQIANPDLQITEIMVFDNNAYVRVTEKSTGIGAMELLVDPTTLSVYPEYGPNMMWNLKYGHMAGAGSYSGMMGRWQVGTSVSSAMTVTPDQAVKIAQQYLDSQFPGDQAHASPDAFYGYYTIDILKDGQSTGMLSVNGFSGQVFLHTWHETFVTSWE